MNYMVALWMEITNSYSKWPPLACIQSISLCGHSSTELHNTSTGNLQLPSEETTLNFQYWYATSCKPSPEAWTTIFSPRRLGLDLQKAKLKWRWGLGHLSPATAGLSLPCALGLSCWKLQFCPWKVLQEETSQYWKFKAVSLEGCCRFSSWCVA